MFLRLVLRGMITTGPGRNVFTQLLDVSSQLQSGICLVLFLILGPCLAVFMGDRAGLLVYYH